MLTASDPDLCTSHMDVFTPQTTVAVRNMQRSTIHRAAVKQTEAIFAALWKIHKSIGGEMLMLYLSYYQWNNKLTPLATLIQQIFCKNELKTPAEARQGI